jgi:hypothetical protein
VSLQIPIRTVSGKVSIVDHSGTVLDWVSAQEAAELIKSGKVEILGTRRKVRSLRYFCKDPDIKLTAHRRPGYGEAHARETYSNPKGTWTLERIPERHAHLFQTVIRECSTKPKAA